MVNVTFSSSRSFVPRRWWDPLRFCWLHKCLCPGGTAVPGECVLCVLPHMWPWGMSPAWMSVTGSTRGKCTQSERPAAWLAVRGP